MNTNLIRWLEHDGVRFLQEVGIESGTSVMDFGCRRGMYALPAARLVGADGKVYAVDRHEDILRELAERAATERLRNLCFINTHGDVRLPLENCSVDAVLLYDVIHLIGWAGQSDGGSRRSTAADRRRLLEEVHRISKPETLLSVYVRHLHTHTDVTSEAQIRGEIEGCGFRFQDELHHGLVHDEKFVDGCVLNFSRSW